MSYNPDDVNVDVVSDRGYYIIHKRTKNGYEPITVQPPSEGEDEHEWAMNLDDTELEAMLQVFWDTWNFLSSTDENRAIVDALENERSRRKLNHATFAPGIFK